MSHAAWNVRWDKTMNDIRFLKSKNCKLDKTLFDLLYKDWEKLHGKKQVVLKGSPDQFFTAKITRKYNHEDLHNTVKFYDSPLHKKIRPDPNDVKVSKSLWDKLSYEDQLKCALEEAYVFAIERYHDFPPKIALSKALKQLITSSTKGFFNLFLIDNFFELLYNTNNKFYFRIFKELKNG
jgi:hypothetical protein